MWGRLGHVPSYASQHSWSERGKDISSNVLRMSGGECGVGIIRFGFGCCNRVHIMVSPVGYLESLSTPETMLGHA